MMSVEEISNKNIWNNFLIQNPNASFLQSFEFGDFYKNLGKKIWRLGVYRNENLVGVCLLVKQDTKFGSFLYSPAGPVLLDIENLAELISRTSEIAKAEKTSFVRFDPRLEKEEFNQKALNLGLRLAPSYTQPQCSLRLDLSKSEDELKAALSESTRYNIGWVARQGIKVLVSSDQKEFAIFQKLLDQTSSRQGFVLSNEADYYRKQFETLHSAGLAKLYLTYEPEKVGQEVLAAAIVVNFNQTTTYLHAASSSKSPKLRAPYLMQWQIILDAKAAGSKTYDFWGVAPTDDPKDPWAGVSTFKKSFGGEKICYEKPIDLVISSRYQLDTIIEKIRLITRKWR